MLHIHHLNLQELTGGGEVYTHALTRAFADAGARITLHAHPGNRLWDDLPGERIEVQRASTQHELEASLPANGAMIVTQTALSLALKTKLLAKHRLVEFSHLPITSGRGAEGVRHCHLAVTVSRYCIDLLRRAGIEHLYPEPMYGTTEAQRGNQEPVVARSPYRWDRRKLRDVFLSALEPVAAAFRASAPYEKLPGLTLGVVSLLSTIKQFPLLFQHLAPVLAERRAIRVEIFGDGGYAQVRDIRRALAPLSDRVRFWGYQSNVRSIYPRIDFLLAGLPEKEALGLNVLEAQVCGTPVLAPDAPPFTETVVDGRSGYLYPDPRTDGGAGFASVIDGILAGRPRPDPRIAAGDHLRQFSYAALVERTRPLLARMEHLAA
jgi:glycosyltransferase involved in cell wall biosynthesis